MVRASSVAGARVKTRPAASPRRKGGLRQMPDLLGTVLAPEARARGMAEARRLADWPPIVGPDLAGRCYPVRLTATGFLHLHVGGTAALEVQHSELQLIERINSYFGRPAVLRLRLTQAPTRAEPLRPAKAPLP